MNVCVQSLRTVDGIAIPFECIVSLDEVCAVIADEECKPGVLLELDYFPVPSDSVTQL